MSETKEAEELPIPQSDLGALNWRLGSKLAGLLPYLLVASLAAFFTLTCPAFATSRNLTVVSAQAASLLIVCCGATFVVLMGSIDLSVGAIVLLTGAIAVKLQGFTSAGLIMLSVSLLLGGLLGLGNGLLTAYGAVPSFVVTLGTLSIYSGAALQILQGRALSFESPELETLAIGSWLPPLPNIAICALAVWLGSVIVGQQTRFGRYMYLIGGGELVTHNSGVPVRPYKVAAFVFSGALAGLAGILSTARLGAAGPTLGQDLLLNSLAAIVVGGTSLAGGVGGPERTIVGVLIIAILDNGLNLLGVSSYPQLIIKGAVVILAVLCRADRRAQTVK